MTTRPGTAESGAEGVAASDRNTLAAEPQAAPGPLVSVAWLREHLDDADVRLVHVSADRTVYDQRHLPGAVYGDLHRELAAAGRAAETGEVDREWLVPGRESVEGALKRWGVGPGDRVVLYDDVGQNRHAIRGYWLLRYYGWPRERVHVLDGGLEAWERAAGPETNAAASPRPADPVHLSEPDPALIASCDQVVEWSRETKQGGPIRILDVRTPEEYRGEDVRSRRGGHVPGAVNLPFDRFLKPDNTFRPPEEIRSLVEQVTGGDPSTLRAAHCQGGVRSALAWFALHELAGLDVRNYAGSWEEWGNRSDTPVETGTAGPLTRDER